MATTARVYCHLYEKDWADEIEIVEETPVLLCRRRGSAIVFDHDGTIIAAVERKTLENLAGTLSDGTLAFQMQRLSELPLTAIVIEARYSALLQLEHVNGARPADQLARLHVRSPNIHLVYADTRRHAEDSTHRFLTTALTHTTDPNPAGH